MAIVALIIKLSSARVPASTQKELEERDNWQEFVRQAIAEKLKSA
jgi:hypothetical protein